MKKLFYLFFLMILIIPYMEVSAEDYILSNGVVTKGSYAGNGENDYNYYKVILSKDGFIGIAITTSDKQPLTVDICNENKTVIASDIIIENNQTVLHKGEMGSIYFIRVKGEENVTYNISYKMNNINMLTCEKEYSYTFTNASFVNEENAISLKLKTKKSGVLNFMCETSNKVVSKFYTSKNKEISNNALLEDHSLIGIGVKAKKVYNIKLWNFENSISGTTTINNMKYQIRELSASKNTSKIKSIIIDSKKNRKKETLVTAGNKNTFWYKVKLKNKKKLSLSIESRLFQNTGSYLLVDIYNNKGKRITKNSIVIDDKVSVDYNGTKYIMNYPKKNIVTEKLPKGDYYIRVMSKSQKTSGSFSIILNK